jgi:hypothetical protein
VKLLQSVLIDLANGRRRSSQAVSVQGEENSAPSTQELLLTQLGLRYARADTTACSAPANTQPKVTVSKRSDTVEESDPMRRRTLLAAAGLSIPLSVIERFDDALALPSESSRDEGPAEIQDRLRHARRQFDVSALTALG